MIFSTAINDSFLKMKIVLSERRLRAFVRVRAFYDCSIKNFVSKNPDSVQNPSKYVEFIALRYGHRGIFRVERDQRKPFAVVLQLLTIGVPV